MGLEFDFSVPLHEVPAHYIAGYKGPESYTSNTSLFRRTDDITLPLELVAMRHLEMPGAPEPSIWLDRGGAHAVSLFWDRWLGENDEGVDYVTARDMQLVEVDWFGPFSEGLALCLLLRRWADVEKLCDWVWEDLIPEYSGMGGGLEDELALMYLIVANSLRRTEMPRIGEVIEKVRKCRRKRPRLLLEAWECELAGDDQCFQEAITKSIEHHQTIKIEPRSQKIAERLAMPQTVICHAACRLGMRMPEIPEPLADYLITRDSLELSES